MATAIYEECEKHDIPIIFHTGMGLEGISEEILAMMKQFPKLKIILGHAGFTDIDNIIKKVAIKDNILFDISSLRLFDMYDLIKNVDYRKIVFGSDVPYYDTDWALQGLVDTSIILGKTANQIRKILGENISKWVQ